LEFFLSKRPFLDFLIGRHFLLLPVELQSFAQISIYNPPTHLCNPAHLQWQGGVTLTMSPSTKTDDQLFREVAEGSMKIVM